MRRQQLLVGSELVVIVDVVVVVGNPQGSGVRQVSVKVEFGSIQQSKIFFVEHVCVAKLQQGAVSSQVCPRKNVELILGKPSQTL